MTRYKAKNILNVPIVNRLMNPADKGERTSSSGNTNWYYLLVYCLSIRAVCETGG